MNTIFKDWAHLDACCENSIMTDDKLSRALYDLNDRVYKMERRLSTLEHESEAISNKNVVLNEESKDVQWELDFSMFKLLNILSMQVLRNPDISVYVKNLLIERENEILDKLWGMKNAK